MSKLIFETFIWNNFPQMRILQDTCEVGFKMYVGFHVNSSTLSLNFN